MKLTISILIFLFPFLILGQSTNDGSFKVRKYNSDVPSFPGGESRMNSYLNSRTNTDFSASVHLKFKIRKNGKIRRVRVLAGVNKVVNKKAVNIVKAMPRWEPARLRGKPIVSSYNLTIQFNKTY